MATKRIDQFTPATNPVPSDFIAGYQTDSVIYTLTQLQSAGAATVTTGSDLVLTNPIKSAYTVSFTTPGKKVVLPPANQSNSPTPGSIIVLRNAGSNTFDVYLSDGTTPKILGLQPGINALIYLQDNSTAIGTWSSNVFGTLGQQQSNNVTVTGGNITGTNVNTSLAGALQAANNLSDVSNFSTSRASLLLNPTFLELDLGGDETLTNPLQQNTWMSIFSNTSSSNKIILPPMNASDSIPPGGIFYIENLTTVPATVYSNDMNIQSTVGPNECHTYILMDNSLIGGVFDIRVSGSLSLQNSDNVLITGGEIDGTVIGGTTPTFGQFLVTMHTRTSSFVIPSLTFAGSLNLLNGTFTVTVPQQSTVSLPAGFWFEFKNIGSGTITFAVQGSDTMRNNVSVLPGATGKVVLTTAGTPNTWDMFVGTIPTGRQSLFIRGTGFDNAITNGATISQIESATNKNNIRGLSYDPSTAQYAAFSFSMPKKWDKGTITYQLYAVANSVIGAAIFDLQGVCRNAGDAFDIAYGTAQSVTVTASGAVYNMLVSSESSAVTLAGTINNDCEIELRLWRDATNGGDTLTVNAIVVGIKIFYNVIEANDA